MMNFFFRKEETHLAELYPFFAFDNCFVQEQDKSPLLYSIFSKGKNANVENSFRIASSSIKDNQQD